MLVVPALAGATSSILKQIFARARPDVAPHLDSISNLSFPSGHATSAIAILLLAALIMPARQKTLWIALAGIGAGAIGASRVLLGVHWPSDVLGGFLWGTGFALAGVAAARHWPDARR
jgi:undecaprenyl-diphosphatase